MKVTTKNITECSNSQKSIKIRQSNNHYRPATRNFYWLSIFFTFVEFCLLYLKAEIKFPEINHLYSTYTYYLLITNNICKH